MERTTLGNRFALSRCARWSLVALAAFAVRPALATTAAEQEVLTFEKQRCDAVLHRDIAALRAMVTDDLTYVHASGLKQGKQQYLDYVAAGNVTYTSYSIDPPDIHLGDTAAVTHGTFRYVNGGGVPGSMFYTAFYVRADGGWKLSAWQATITKSLNP